MRQSGPTTSSTKNQPPARTHRLHPPPPPPRMNPDGRFSAVRRGIFVDAVSWGCLSSVGAAFLDVAPSGAGNHITCPCYNDVAPTALPLQRIRLSVSLAKGKRLVARVGKKARARIKSCPGCRAWMWDGKIVHTPKCPRREWEMIEQTQKAQPTQKQKEEIQIRAGISASKRLARLGPSTNAPPPKKAKAHKDSNWPPIVPGGGVETNRRKH